MKKIVGIPGALFVLLAFCTPAARAQGPHFNHTTVYVTDLQKSADFYEKVMRLKKIPEPFHDGKHVWFDMGNHGQLHVVLGAKEIVPHDINIHLAFSVHPYEPFLKHLDGMGIKYGNWAQNSQTPQVRPDGIKQVYFQDPDGYWLEVDDDNF
ncbi:MAG: VOC family protein [Puia sp.]|nr:VOC family protein [Puia sp.]